MALTVSSCSRYSGLDTYDANSLGSNQATFTGTVTGVETVKVKGQNTGTGATVGAVAGGLTSSMLGSGKGRYGNAAWGGVLGAIAGQQVEKMATNTTGQRITVRRDEKYNGSRT